MAAEGGGTAQPHPDSRKCNKAGDVRSTLSPTGELPSSSVHQHETSASEQDQSGVVSEGNPQDLPAVPQSPYQKFRHGGWFHLRRRTREAMVKAGFSDKTLQRFDQCGANAYMWRSSSTRRRIITAEFCKCRGCVPCQNAKSALLAANLSQFIHRRNVRFITFTLKHRGSDLKTLIDRIWKCYKLLRTEQEYKDHVRGAFAALESKWIHKTREWHVHLHTLCEGSFWAQKDISKLWFACTGDSYIVDVRRPDDDVRTARYVCKYVTKPFDRDATQDPQAFEQAVRILARRRLYLITGIWAGQLKLLAKPPDPKDWEIVGNLENLWKQAADGDADVSLWLAEAFSCPDWYETGPPMPPDS